MYTTTTVMTVVAALAAVADAHVAFFNPAMFGFDYPNQNKWPYTDGDRDANYGNGRPNNPLRAVEAHPESFWLGNGLRDYPPPPNVFAEIPSGGVATYDTGGDRSKTRWRKWDMGQELAKYCTETNFNMHTINDYGKTPNLEYLGGTAIAIAYTSDANAVKGEDFTVISVNWASPWYTRPTFPMPRGMPPCPPGGCLCTWNWIHTAGNKHPVTGKEEGYGSEIYNILFRCMVTGDTDENNVIPKGAVPTACDGEIENGGGELTNCTTGPKVPMYLWQGDGNNMSPPPEPRGGWKNPTYNWRYGFKDGAQQDAVVRRGEEAKANGKGSVARTHRDDLFEEGKGGMSVVNERGEPLAAGKLSADVEKLLVGNNVFVEPAGEPDIGSLHVAVGVDGADINAGVDAANPETLSSSKAPKGSATPSASAADVSASASGSATESSAAPRGGSSAANPSSSPSSQSGGSSAAAPSASGSGSRVVGPSSSGAAPSGSPSASGAAPSGSPSPSASGAALSGSPSASAPGSAAPTPSKGKGKCKRSRRRRHRL